jgi:hypothetical protein
MLPAGPAQSRSIAGVAPDLLASLRGESQALRPVTSAVLVVVDGLGALPLRAHAGHARTLTAAMGKKDAAASVFPTTTAAALTTLLTGEMPGAHGLVGYRVRDPRRDVLVNQLTEWESAGIDPHTYILTLGWKRVISYQPAGRFWTFQLLEAGLFVGLAVVAVLVALWLVRRTPA